MVNGLIEYKIVNTKLFF